MLLLLLPPSELRRVLETFRACWLRIGFPARAGVCSRRLTAKEFGFVLSRVS